MKINIHGLNIEVQEHGNRSHPAVLLIMGLGMQLVAWPPYVVEPLVQAGFRVITFDNRDIGLSEHLDHLGIPNILWASLKRKLGWRISAPYGLPDMAGDALGVLDALKIQQAHVIGASMGGMIAQRLTAQHPERILSLTSIMSSSGAPGLPDAKPAVIRALLSRPAGRGTDAIVAHYERLFAVIGSPAYPIEPALLRQRIRSGVERSYHPQGTLRQMVAIAADQDRHHALSRISTRTLVLHGLSDVLVPPAHGSDTAQRIANAKFIGIEGMGHDLAPGAVAQWIHHLLTHLKHEHA